MMAKSDTRGEIVRAADQLFYTHGFEHTSFAHIAEVVEISRGNFYYYFKTKDEILDAVIQQRLLNTKAMLKRWEIEGDTPQQRITHFIHILLVNQNKIKHYGCPVGSLFTELSKLQHTSKDQALALFDLFRAWLKNQFLYMGYEDDADDLAMHILSRSQGVATLASAYPDEAFLEREVQHMCAWLDALSSQTKPS